MGSQSQHTPPKTVLLVEDNPSDIELTKLAVRNARIRNGLVVVQDGEEALDYLFGTGAFAGRNNSLPALILLDLKLPKIGGLEVLRSIRGDLRTSHIPVVILSTSKDEPDVASAYGLGANSYIQKPVNFKQFVAAIQQLDSYWLVLNEPPPDAATKIFRSSHNRSL